MPLSLNNESSSSRSSQDLSDSSVEKSPKPYELWTGGSLFPSWKDLNGSLPEHITAPDPSELPLPSPKLISFNLNHSIQSESVSKNEVEATSTTDEYVPDDLESEDGKLSGKKSKVMTKWVYSKNKMLIGENIKPKYLILLNV